MEDTADVLNYLECFAGVFDYLENTIASLNYLEGWTRPRLPGPLPGMKAINAGHAYLEETTDGLACFASLAAVNPTRLNILNWRNIT